MIDNTRLLQPTILATKQELLSALKTGQIKTTKYNVLTEAEKLYVELVCFGGYTGEQAVRAIDPGILNPKAAANRMLANPDVQECIEELTVAKDKKFQAEIQANRDLAMQKLMFIMNTTKDESLAVSCAKIIMDKAEAATKKTVNKEDEPVGQVSFNIQVENVYTHGATPPRSEEPVIIELTPEEIDPSIKEAKALKSKLTEETKALKKKLPKKVNPDTGLPYTLMYEGVNNYVDNQMPEETD